VITVRFPTGFSVQYNSAAHVETNPNGYSDLYTAARGQWVAQVPTAGCIIEAVTPCRTYSAAGQPDTVWEEVRELRRSIESLKRRIAKEAKR
jgi:hypothetical protein